MRYLFALAFLASSLFAQSTPLILESDAVYPRRFLAAHGERAIIEGYSSQGLEAWAYPYQLFRDYRLSVRRSGDTTAVDSTLLLRRVQYTPSTITRIYAGPDFVLRETLFVPRESPAILISFTVESPAPVDILVHLLPVMDLMWPASTGGQGAQWSRELSGYMLSENEGTRALISSPQMVAHDDQWNSTQDVFRGELAFTVKASSAQPATIVVNANTAAPGGDLASASRKLLADADSLLRASEEHYKVLLDSSLQIETPEPALNSELQWATVAVDQSWICNADFGCAISAGYGPSRRARRPQYQWFFAGDGLITTEALLNLGQFARSRQELEFILKHQDPATGMIWHEISQSARHLDWIGKFPYMYVHVDLSFQFLDELLVYVQRTGDIDFLRTHWKQIQAAYRYCESTVDPVSHLPHIPESKSGANEQDKLSDELSLSTAWLSTSRSFAAMATLVGDRDSAAAAQRSAELAAPLIAPRYWDEKSNFVVSAFTQDNRPVQGRTLSASSPELLALLSSEQRNSLLDQIASADFQTDWGPRSMAPGENYAPATYAKGSVWPLATASVAQTFWSTGRSWQAEAIWRTLFPGQFLDSLGHLPEVYSGSFYREQEESVPEQTWSSASLISITTEGLLGLGVDAAGHRRLRFSPSLPASWNSLRVRNLQLEKSALSLEINCSPGALELAIDNRGEPFALDFNPLLPLGAKVLTVKLQDRSIPFSQVAPEADARYETRPAIAASVPRGSSRIVIAYTGGVSLLVPLPAFKVGDTSHAYKIRSVELDAQTIHFHLDVPSDRASEILLRSAHSLGRATGARLESGPGPHTWRLVFDPRPGVLGYSAAEASVEVAPN